MEQWGLCSRQISPHLSLLSVPTPRFARLPPNVQHHLHLRTVTTSGSPLRGASQLNLRLSSLHHTPASQRRKTTLTGRRTLYGNADPTVMTTVVELATVPSADTSQTCIHVRHDKCHYIFGRIAEGSQRAFGSRRIGFGGVTQIFLSGSVGWEQLGGMVGFLLTISTAAESSKESQLLTNSERQKKGQKLLKLTKHEGVGVHAADNISHILATNRSVIFRQPLNVRISEHRDDPRAVEPTNLEPDWQDGMIRVWKVPTTRARSSSPRKRRRMSPGNEGVGTQADAEFKNEQTVSDPDVPRLIVEQLLFNGDQKDHGLLPRRVEDLKPTDTAFYLKDGVLQRYKGSSQENGDALSPDQTVWVLPTPGQPKAQQGDEKPWRLEHLPLPRTSYSQTSMSYIVKTHDRRGKFDRAAAESLGVQKCDFKHLIAGDEVKGKDGKIVTADMVLGDRLPGRGFIVADISGLDFIDSFMQRPEWENPELMTNISVMYWLLGSGMSSDPRIQQFMQNHSEIRHVICAPDTCPNMITLPGPAELQMTFRRVDPERFPILNYDNVVKAPAPAAGSDIQFGRAGSRLQLMPRLLFEDEHMAPFPDLVAASNSVSSEVMSLAQQAKAKATDPGFLAKIEESEKDIPNRDTSITCLGTGSSVPSKYRNVSGTLVRVPGIGNYLLDAGEGTIGQMRRIFGAEETAKILRDLKCVVISHLHADHHLGAISVFRAWYEQALADGNNTNLAVSCISRYRDILREVSQVEDFGFHRLRFPSCPPGSRKDVDLATKEHFGGDDFGITAIKRVPVPHCWRSMGTELELTSGLRIAWSGDCRPSQDFAVACRGAHLLVHECTFDDDMADHARHKMHSTMSEALGVAREMQARRVLLTHFSQRYIKADSLSWQGDADVDAERSVLLGFDYMTVKLGDFQKAACYTPALEKLMEKADDQ